MNEQMAQALAALRDIHEPLTPSFWPIPIGWWLLAICLIFGFVLVVIWLKKRRYGDRPYREIRHVAEKLQDKLNNGLLTPVQYANDVNRLFKHLLVNVESVPGAAQSRGMAWQLLLAQRFEDDGFVTGPGLTLGTARYMRVPYTHEDLTGLVDKTLCKVRRNTVRAEPSNA